MMKFLFLILFIIWEKRTFRAIVALPAGIVTAGYMEEINKENRITSRSERNRRPGHLLGHVSTSAERSRTSVGISTGTCAGTKFLARCISGGELEPGLFTVGSIGCIRKGRLRRTRSEDAEMADRGMCATY